MKIYSTSQRAAPNRNRTPSSKSHDPNDLQWGKNCGALMCIVHQSWLCTCRCSLSPHKWIHMACNHAHTGTDACDFALQDALQDQPSQHGGGWSHESGGHCTGCHSVRGGQSRTTVESQPAKPKEAATQDHERDVGRAHFLLHMPAGSKDCTGNQARHTGADVNHSTTCKVKSSHLSNPATCAPNPVAQRCVDQKGPKSKHDAVSTETHALHQRAWDNGRSNDCKGHLECSEHKGWKARVTPHLHVQIHPKTVVEVANDVGNPAVAVVTKGPWETKDHPSQGDNSHGHHTHHHGVDDVGVSNQATIEEAKPCGHQEHKGCRGQDPGNCAGVHSIFGQSWVGHCCGRLREETTTRGTAAENKTGFQACKSVATRCHKFLGTTASTMDRYISRYLLTKIRCSYNPTSTHL